MSNFLARPDVDTSPARGGATVTARLLVLTGLATVGVLHLALVANAFATNRALAITYLAVMLSCAVVAVAWRPADSRTETRTGTTNGSDAHPLLVEDHRPDSLLHCVFCLIIAADQPEEHHLDRSRGRQRSAA